MLAFIRLGAAQAQVRPEPPPSSLSFLQSKFKSITFYCLVILPQIPVCFHVSQILLQSLPIALSCLDCS